MAGLLGTAECPPLTLTSGLSVYLLAYHPPREPLSVTLCLRSLHKAAEASLATRGSLGVLGTWRIVTDTGCDG